MQNEVEFVRKTTNTEYREHNSADTHVAVDIENARVL